MNFFKDKVALITGASSGIGRAIALALAKEGAICCLVGRSREKLDAIATLATSGGASSVHVFDYDLTIDQNIQLIKSQVGDHFTGIDFLVHSAGIFSANKVQDASLDDFDNLYKANVRAPFLLTQSLLPMLRKSFGQIVFINSSQGLTGRANASQFSSTQHSLRAIADSLRDEVNGDGIKVISLYLGRTATPRMESLFQKEGKAYQPELLLQPEDVAAVVINTLSLPRTAEVTNISIRPMIKSY